MFLLAEEMCKQFIQEIDARASLVDEMFHDRLNSLRLNTDNRFVSALAREVGVSSESTLSINKIIAGGGTFLLTLPKNVQTLVRASDS